MAETPTIFPEYYGVYADGTLSLSSYFSGEIWLDSVDRFNGKTTYMFDVNTTKIDATNTSGGVLLAGNSLNNEILSGSGSSTLWGGTGGDDVFTCGTSRDYVWFGQGCGKDTAGNFKLGNNSSSDVLVLYDGSVTNLDRSGNSLSLKMNDGSELTVASNTDWDNSTSILYTPNNVNIYQARIGEKDSTNVFYWSSLVNYYSGGSKTDILSVTGTAAHEIWLDGRNGVGYSGIEQVNSFAATGANIIAGAWESESLVGGRGSTSLWGGFGGDDTLHGGAGVDTFWYGKNEGNDVILNSSTSDYVKMYNISLADIDCDRIAVSDLHQIYLPMKGGGSLTVSFGDNITSTFVLDGDGTTWRYNFSTSQWSSN